MVPERDYFRNFEKAIYLMILKLSVVVHSSLAKIFFGVAMAKS